MRGLGKTFLVFSLVLVLILMPFASANVFTDIWGKITGESIRNAGQECELGYDTCVSGYSCIDDGHDNYVNSRTGLRDPYFGTCLKVSTCTDGIKNGAETGIDCGGSCDDCLTVEDETESVTFEIYENARLSHINRLMEINYITDESVKIKFIKRSDRNGEVTSELRIGESQTMSNGDVVTINSIRYAPWEDNVRAVSITLAGCMDCVEEYEDYCEDSDGGQNIYVKGDRLSNYGSWAWQAESDFCILNPTPSGGSLISDGGKKVYSCEGENCGLIEKGCFDQIYQAHIGYMCPNGCVDGACLEDTVPTCYDGVMNGAETGVDCGGNCNVCETDLVESGCYYVDEDESVICTIYEVDPVKFGDLYPIDLLASEILFMSTNEVKLVIGLDLEFLEVESTSDVLVNGEKWVIYENDRDKYSLIVDEIKFSSKESDESYVKFRIFNDNVPEEAICGDNICTSTEVNCPDECGWFLAERGSSVEIAYNNVDYTVYAEGDCQGDVSINFAYNDKIEEFTVNKDDEATDKKYSLANGIGFNINGMPCSVNSLNVGLSVIPTVSETCVDSDEGANYEQFGVVVVGENIFQDSCSGENSTGLSEYICDDTFAGWNWQSVKCVGGCVDGACLTDEVEAPSCTDFDGRDIFTASSAESEFGSGQRDCCVNGSGSCVEEGTHVREGLCRSITLVGTSPVTSETIECENGCFEGACIKGENWTEGADLIVTGIDFDYSPSNHMIEDGNDLVAYFNIDYVGTVTKDFFVNLEILDMEGNVIDGCGTRVYADRLGQASCGADDFNKAGRYDFVVTVDEDNDIDETDEDNNVYIMPFDVGTVISSFEDCSGCFADDKCYNLGYRKGDNFCSETFGFTGQFTAGSSCDNNFECGSNLCISGECISESFWNKVMDFFSRLFS